MAARTGIENITASDLEWCVGGDRDRRRHRESAESALGQRGLGGDGLVEISSDLGAIWLSTGRQRGPFWCNGPTIWPFIHSRRGSR